MPRVYAKMGAHDRPSRKPAPEPGLPGLLVQHWQGLSSAAYRRRCRDRRHWLEATAVASPTLRCLAPAAGDMGCVALVLLRSHKLRPKLRLQDTLP